MPIYNPNIPASNTNPSQDQPLIQQNFQTINTAFNLNHGQLDNAGIQGKHLFMQMPAQVSTPTTLANEGVLYTQTSTLSGLVELVYGRQSTGTQIEFTSSLAATNGWTRLPSGILLKWGQSINITGNNGGLQINFPSGATIPAFTTVFTGYITTFDSSPTPNTFVYLTDINVAGTGFKVFVKQRTSSLDSTGSFYYFFIGV